MMIERGDRVPHFVVTTTDGRVATYADTWQQRNLLLVCTPREGVSEACRSYTARIASRQNDLAALETDVVTTAVPVPGVPCPGVVVADRWGEVMFVAAADDCDALPHADDLLEWIQFVQHRCPECEGESR